MGKRHLTEKQVYEIWYLGNEGCPCCKVPLPANLLADRYGCSNSTASRIINNYYRVLAPTNGEGATRKELADLKRRVYAERVSEPSRSVRTDTGNRDPESKV